MTHWKAVLGYIRKTPRAVSMPDLRRVFPDLTSKTMVCLVNMGYVRRVFRGWYEDARLPPVENPAEVAVGAIRAADCPLVMNDLAAFRLRPEQVSALVEQGVLTVSVEHRYGVTGDPKQRTRAFVRPRKSGLTTKAIEMLRAAPTVTLAEFEACGITLSVLRPMVSKGRIRRIDKTVYALVERPRRLTLADRVLKEFEEVAQPMSAEDIVERWKVSRTILYNLANQGRLVRLDTGVYGLPGQTLAQYVRKRPESLPEKTLRLLREANGPLTIKQLMEQGVNAYAPVRMAAEGRIRRVKYGVYCLPDDSVKGAA